MFKGFLGDCLGIFIGFFRGFLAVVFSYHKLGLCWCNPLARSAGLFLANLSMLACLACLRMLACLACLASLGCLGGGLSECLGDV